MFNALTLETMSPGLQKVVETRVTTSHIGGRAGWWKSPCPDLARGRDGQPPGLLYNGISTGANLGAPPPGLSIVSLYRFLRLQVCFHWLCRAARALADAARIPPPAFCACFILPGVFAYQGVCPADPPPIAPARSRQATCDWVASTHDVARGLISDVCAVGGVFHTSECLPSRLHLLSSQPTPAAPTPLPSCAACPDCASPRAAVLWAAGGAPRRGGAKRPFGFPIRGGRGVSSPATGSGGRVFVGQAVERQAAHGEWHGDPAARRRSGSRSPRAGWGSAFRSAGAW